MVPVVVKNLVTRFTENSSSYSASTYNETQLRREFLDPFFEALGWDVSNKQGHAEAYKEVIHEDAVKVGTATKAPDYSFRVGGTRKFFVEAKKPFVNIKDDISPAFQLRRYAWSGKLPLSILTDFEEFAVYDCRIKPNKNDKASVGRILYIRFDEYEKRWDEIATIFSKDSILKGSFDKYAESAKGKKGTSEVDNEFLGEIERWRDLLARNIAIKNPNLSQRELNFAIQRTIDRIIFLRICEDRGIEHYGTLMALLNGDNVYKRMRQNFQRADEIYNSGLFHFRDEKGRAEPPDTLTLSLQIDDKPLKDIIANLYYPDCPYEFSVLPADILGQVYEQFLGKVIRLTVGHQAKVEDKPEVKKAGGVFYTPTYIVDYIVKNTVGKLIEDKPPKQIEKIKILDPACGSGSFLIQAYQFLLDYHRDWYIKDGFEKNSKGKEPKLTKVLSGEWRLSTSERKKILLNNIYGVDIDSQAVEVTKLSLLLKVLEGENEQSLAHQMTLWHERALPDLENNIKCGNSLIGTDFYEGTQTGMNLFEDEEHYRINAFNWDGKDGFQEIIKNGGFDAVIGNPPYVDIKALPDPEIKYIFAKYSFANNRINLFAAFIEKSLSLIKSTCSRFSMIIPTALFTQDSYQGLRRNIIDNYHIANIVRLPNESFGVSAGDVKVDTGIFVIDDKKNKNKETEIIAYSGYDRIFTIDTAKAYIYCQIDQECWNKSSDRVWSINSNETDSIVLNKCESQTFPLENCAKISLGLTPYDKYKGHTQDQISQQVFHAQSKKDKTFKKLLAGNDVGRYWVCWNRKQWISYGPWLGAPREPRFFTEKRILVKQIIDWTTKRIWATITDEELYNTQNAFNLLPKPGWNLEYLLGILNSRLMTYYHRKKFLDEFKMRFQKILIKDCRRFPIHQIKESSSLEKTIHDKIVDAVSSMLDLNHKLPFAKTDHEKTIFQRQIDSTDRRIDELVYELYGLTKEDIKIVEGTFDGK